MTDDLDIEALLEAPFKRESAREHAASRDKATARERESEGEARDNRGERDRHSRDGDSSRERYAAPTGPLTAKAEDRGRRYSSRSRSRSPHRRHSREDRGRDRDRDRGRDRSRDHGHSHDSDQHHRSHHYYQQQHHHHHQHRRGYSPQRARSPVSVVLTEAQRDRRTVFCRQLAQRLDSKQLREFCEQAGRVRDARIVYDKISKRSKGVGYVEFYEEESVPLAVALTGKKLSGIPIIIELTETEKNRIAEEAAAALRMEKLAAATANIAPARTAQGPHDRDALHSPSAAAAAPPFLAPSHYSPHGDDEHQGESLESMERILNPEGSVSVTDMMLRMARDTVALKGLASTRPSPCILLQHMYDPAAESAPDWDVEIAEEVHEECSKFGRVEHIHVPKTTDGDVFVRFASTDSAQATVASLNGRWFGGMQVSALFIPLNEYLSRYPK